MFSKDFFFFLLSCEKRHLFPKGFFREYISVKCHAGLQLHVAYTKQIESSREKIWMSFWILIPMSE